MPASSLPSALIIGSGLAAASIKAALPGAINCAPDEPAGQSADLPFDLRCDDPTSLPSAQALIICPALDICPDPGALLRASRRYAATFILSTAKVFCDGLPNSLLTELAPRRPSARAQAEIPFLHDAVILHLGLLWDDGARQPGQWITQGRIRNGAKYVNLLHVEDLAALLRHWTLLSAQRPTPGSYLLSDGSPVLWDDLARPLHISLPQLAPGPESRRYDSTRIEPFLPPQWRWRRPRL